MTDEKFIEIKGQLTKLTLNNNPIQNLNNIDNDIFGTVISINQLIGKYIHIIRFKTQMTKKNDKIHMPAHISIKMLVRVSDTECYVVYTSSKFIKKKLEDFESKLPLGCTIYKSGKTYTLV